MFCLLFTLLSSWTCCNDFVVKDVNHPATPSTTAEEEDLQRENDTQALLDYIEKFNELLENKMYNEAAIHAANSIKGILRTPETMQRFKGKLLSIITGASQMDNLCYFFVFVCGMFVVCMQICTYVPF